jgi:hypothetical protein
MAQVIVRSKIEIGTRESALCTLENIQRAIRDLKDVRRHVRGDHKRQIDDAITVFRIIAFEAMKTYAITGEEAQAALAGDRRGQRHDDLPGG